MDKTTSLERKKVEALRREYAREELTEANIKSDPLDQFAVWFQQALSSELLDANAMTLATAGSDAAPSVRIVLLKGFDKEGFRFYTNYESSKGRELAENPKAALCFYWAPLERQVRIRGTVEKLSRAESEQYFDQRPRSSQLGAWASRQSTPIGSREQLVDRYKKLDAQFDNQSVPIPDFWGGYLLHPTEIEFWQGRPSRLHDRFLYAKSEENWKISRLSP